MAEKTGISKLWFIRKCVSLNLMQFKFDLTVKWFELRPISLPLYLIKFCLYAQMDPYLALDEDMRLQVTCTKPGEDNCYGSQKDEAAAVEALSAMELKDQQLKETLLTHLVSKLENLSEVLKITFLTVPCKFIL